mmetsp:Transcript_13504/g.29609  ORF Transcript_13504/g.29609 Transcript_13504/m.29609 type:complete len:219 (-) Transcript_13504:507-1163(-)
MLLHRGVQALDLRYVHQRLAVRLLHYGIILGQLHSQLFLQRRPLRLPKQELSVKFLHLLVVLRDLAVHLGAGCVVHLPGAVQVSLQVRSLLLQLCDLLRQLRGFSYPRFILHSCSARNVCELRGERGRSQSLLVKLALQVAEALVELLPAGGLLLQLILLLVVRLHHVQHARLCGRQLLRRSQDLTLPVLRGLRERLVRSIQLIQAPLKRLQPSLLYR